MFPIDHAVGQRAGCHDTHHQRSMSLQALIFLDSLIIWEPADRESIVQKES